MQTIGRRGGEVAFDQVGCRPRVTIPHSGGYPLAPAYAVKARVSHQPRYPLAPDVNPLGGQFRMNPRSPISGARALMNGHDPALSSAFAKARAEGGRLSRAQ
jgi:hypothetical protein